MLVDVTTYHLEITDPAALRPKPNPIEGLVIQQVGKPSPEFNRFLYTAVGVTGTGWTGCPGTTADGKNGWTAPSYRHGWLTYPGARLATLNWTGNRAVAWR